MPSLPVAPLNVEPLPHQEELAERIENMPGQVAMWGTGSGKTIGAINAAHQNQMPLLAITPAALRNNMKGTIERTGFPHPSQVVSYNEALKRLHDPAFRDFAANSLVAIDEAHLTGQQTSARNKLLSELPANRRLMMTATPARNRPEELAPLINAAMPGSLPNDPATFRQQFIQSEEKPVGFWGRAMGVKPGVTETPTNLGEFEKAVKGKVHYYDAVDRKDYPSASESIINVPMGDKQQAAYNLTMGKYPLFAYKLRHGLPPEKNEDADFAAFMMGPRQVANHPGAFHSGATNADAPKILKAADEIQARHQTDPHFRGVAYSSFLGSGVNPLSEELTKRGIPHAVFTGEQDDAERKQIVHNYNTGKVPVLLISGAGAAGLDLKGTKLLQVLEPHWNEKTIDQVRGRAIRYKSHEHLPENERHVEIQRFHSVPQPTWFDKLMGRTHSKDLGPDEYVYRQAKAKDKLLHPFLEIMKGRPASEVEAEQGLKTSSPIPVTADNAVRGWVVSGGDPRATVFLDLDGTVVNSNHRGIQQILPNRLPVLLQLYRNGVRLIGVTNRAPWSSDQTVLDTISDIGQTESALLHMLEDVYFCPTKDATILKPTATLITTAAAFRGVQTNKCYFVGNSPEDRGAAAAASIPYYDGEEFFREAAKYLKGPQPLAGLPITDLPADWYIHGDCFELPLTAALAAPLRATLSDLGFKEVSRGDAYFLQWDVTVRAVSGVWSSLSLASRLLAQTATP